MLIPNSDVSLIAQVIDDVAALLPEESRLGWYRNVRPWLRMLPPEDEVAHLAYSMGYLALPTRSTPALIAPERVKLVPLVQRLSEEVNGAVKTSAVYHQKLNDSLNRLPGEIAEGLSAAALAAEIVDRVPEQFLGSGIPAAGRLLKEQGDSFHRIVTEQSRLLGDVKDQLNESRDRAKYAFETVVSSADSVTKSIDKWNHEMCAVQWVHIGLTLLIGILLGSLLFWSAFPPVHVTPTQQSQGIKQSAPPGAISGKASPHAPK